MTTETLNHIAPYEPLRAQIAELKEANANTVFRYEEPKGNKLARSHVASLRSIKGDVERKRKELKADALEYGRKVDSVAKELSGEIEAMIDVHQGPLDLIESREEARVARHQENIAALMLIPGIEIPGDSVAIRAKLARIKAIVVDDKWQEFKTQGLEAQAATCRALETLLTKLLAQEGEAAELARLRDEQAKRDADNRVKLEAEARAKREEEIRAGAEAKAAAEAARLAMIVEAQNAAKAQAAINAERQKTQAALMAVEKAKVAAAEAEARVAREERERKEAEAKRAANVKHREKVIDEAVEALVRSTEIDRDDAKNVIHGIIAGEIPHVSINF